LARPFRAPARVPGKAPAAALRSRESLTHPNDPPLGLADRSGYLTWLTIMHFGLPHRADLPLLGLRSTLLRTKSGP
jgi:hypothetical protein